MSKNDHLFYQNVARAGGFHMQGTLGSARGEQMQLKDPA